jgi:hypothetical protein
MKISLTKLGVTTMWFGIVSFIAGLSLLVLTACFSITKWLLLKVFNLIFG